MVIFNKIIQNIVCAVTLLFVTTNAYSTSFKTLRTGSGISAILYSTKNPANEKNLHVQVPGDSNIYYGGLTTIPIEDTIRMSIDDTVYYLKLSEPVEPSFFVSLTDITAGETFEIQLSAQGNFTIDCGNGNVQTINRTDTTNTTYSCTYISGGNYTVGIGGLAISYSATISTAISFYSSAHAATHPNRAKMTGISGDLGQIFPILNATTSGSPRFYQTFRNTAITSMPPELFASVQGAPTNGMFYQTFYNCSGLTSIPAGLFSGITGAPATNMFYQTFYNCSGLTSIPAGLFSGITGAPASSMFSGTFQNCSGLSGSIPAGLFGNLTGAPATAMFGNTFNGCSGLISIPEGLFSGITGAPASSMFSGTFQNCSGLISIPEGLFSGITGAPASGMFQDTFNGCSGLSGSIPAGLFGNLTGAPAGAMFNRTFYDCSGLTGSIPEGLFGNLTGTPASMMFNRTFFGNTGLRGSSAKSDGQYLYEKWPDAGDGCYGGNAWQNLDDAASIPSTWR